MLNKVIELLEEPVQEIVKCQLSKISWSNFVTERSCKNPFGEYNSEGARLSIDFDMSSVPLEDIGDVILVSSYLKEQLLLIDLFVSGLIERRQYALKSGLLNGRLSKILELKEVKE